MILYIDKTKNKFKFNFEIIISIQPVWSIKDNFGFYPYKEV